MTPEHPQLLLSLLQYPMMMAATRFVRSFHAAVERAAGPTVTVLGANGGIGQPLSLLLKLSKEVSNLRLYDLVGTRGVATDLSHIPSKAAVSGYVGPEELSKALIGADVVVIPAGVPRKPGMTRDDLFNTNAGIVKVLVQACAKHCPDAHLLIISNPVNSTVPLAADILQSEGVYNPKHLFGVTTLDVLRANTFVAEAQKWDDHKEVAVVGGHAGITILPLLSQLSQAKFTQEEIEKLTHRIQFGGDEVVKAKDGAGSATLSMAMAGVRFTTSLLRALRGEHNIIECSYVASTVAGKDVPFFSSKILLGKNGVEKIYDLGTLSAFEMNSRQKMLPELKQSIEKGVEFANRK